MQGKLGLVDFGDQLIGGLDDVQLVTLQTHAEKHHRARVGRTRYGGAGLCNHGIQVGNEDRKMLSIVFSTIGKQRLQLLPFGPGRVRVK